jgi:hypothetical protein
LDAEEVSQLADKLGARMNRRHLVDAMNDMEPPDAHGDRTGMHCARVRVLFCLLVHATAPLRQLLTAQLCDVHILLQERSHSRCSASGWLTWVASGKVCSHRSTIPTHVQCGLHLSHTVIESPCLGKCMHSDSVTAHISPAHPTPEGDASGVCHARLSAECSTVLLQTQYH